MDGTAAATGFRDALALLDRRIEREIARLRARYQLSLDEFRGLYVSDEQVDRLIGETASPLREHAVAFGPIAATLDLGAAWRHAVETFNLAALDQDLLLLALAPEIDLKYETLFAYLNNDITRKWPTLDLARRLLSTSDGPGALAVAHALGPHGALCAQRLIETVEPPASRPSRLNSGFALRPVAARYLLGERLTPHAACAALAGDDAWHDLPFAPEQIEQLRGLTLLFADGDHPAPVVALLGDAGSGRQLAADVVARALCLPLRCIDGAALRRTGTAPATAVENLALELRLEPGIACISGAEALCERDGRLPPDAWGLLEAFTPSTPVLLLASRSAPWRELAGARRVLPVAIELPNYAQRLVLWQRALGAAGIAVADTDCAALADRFRFGPAQIRDTVRRALDNACFTAARNTPPAVQLLAAARAQSEERLGALASKVEASSTWDELVLPPASRAHLRELSAAIQHRHVVYAQWGFARRVTCGTGVKALFAGASGTGKTMATGVIARELGLDLYKIDLAGVVSKYIGETEKNLDRIFDAARRGNAILFFDEADAVFGKRSEVKDAHDRYANVEAAYLLQRLEEHDGVVILASNFKRNIDEAFARRLHYVVDFPKPDAAQREQLWRGMFPPAAPRADDLDFAWLAQQFELPGGDIRNVVLDAAFLAACAAQPIGMRQVVQALKRQLTKQGKACARADFGRYFALIDEPTDAAQADARA